MTKLGDAIFLAMADQAWGLIASEYVIVAWSPVTGATLEMPADAFDEPDLELELLAALVLLVEHGLIWPWPPEHREGIYGETPRYRR